MSLEIREINTQIKLAILKESEIMTLKNKIFPDPVVDNILPVYGRCKECTEYIIQHQQLKNKRVCCVNIVMSESHLVEAVFCIFCFRVEMSN